jgi:protein TonB
MSLSNQGASPNARFLAGSVPGGENDKRRFGNAVGVSFLSHIVGVLLILFIASRLPDITPRPSPPPDRLPSEIVWLTSPGPGGGGGGGGNKMPEPPRKAEAPGEEKITVPAAKPPKVEAPPEEPKPEPEQPPLTIPAQPMQAGLERVPGVLSSVPSMPTISQGTGTGGGAGTGNGSGVGPGQGSGLGPGYGGNFGGGAARPGNGIAPPTLIRPEAKPNYTAEAMRAKIQGRVTLEAVVLADGSVGPVRVIRSLDPTFGLDQEAIKTAKLWRFSPGTNRTGEPIPVLVVIEMDFTLR